MLRAGKLLPFLLTPRPAPRIQAAAWNPANPLAVSLPCWLILPAWCGLLFYYGLVPAELWRTESLRAIIAEGMLRTGDWIVPTLYGEPLLTKPPGMYIAIALCSLPWGEVTELSARLPSAIAASVAVFLFYRLFARNLGRTAGLFAGLILPMSVVFLDKAPAAEIDMLQVAWVVASLMCFLRALEAVEDNAAFGQQLCWWLGALFCVAGGFLTKWTAPVFFYLTVGSMLWWRGRLRLLWSLQHLVSIALASCVCLAWVAAVVHQVGLEFFVNSVLAEALPRLWVPASNPQHQRLSFLLGALAYPFWILVTAAPWSIVALWSFKRGFASLWDDRGRRLLVLLHCWAWPNLLFWTLMADHTPRYAMPLCPAIAGLAALVFFAWWTQKMPLPWPRIPPVRFLFGMMAIWLVVKVAFVEVMMPARTVNRQPRAKGRLLASLIPAGATLYLFGIKDEGIMFYFGGNVIRLPSPQHLPSTSEPVYCILNIGEWEQLSVAATRQRSVLQGTLQVICRLHDERGAPLVLAAITSETP